MNSFTQESSFAFDRWLSGAGTHSADGCTQLVQKCYTIAASKAILLPRTTPAVNTEQKSQYIKKRVIIRATIYKDLFCSVSAFLPLHYLYLEMVCMSQALLWLNADGMQLTQIFHQQLWPQSGFAHGSGHWILKYHGQVFLLLAQGAAVAICEEHFWTGYLKCDSMEDGFQSQAFWFSLPGPWQNLERVEHLP